MKWPAKICRTLSPTSDVGLKVLQIFAILFLGFLMSSNTASAATVNSSSPESPSLRRGLVGHWTFDAKDMKNNVADRSGLGNTGYMQGFTSTSSAVTAGKIGQGLKFDGVNDYVKSGTLSDSALTESGPVTVSAWVKPRSLGQNSSGNIFSRDGNAGPYLRMYTTGNLFFGVLGGTNLYRLSTANSINLNSWQHVVVTWDGTASYSNMHIYINGSNRDANGQDGISLTDNSTRNFYIGNNSNLNRTFDGLIDDVRIYNRALSPSEIKQLYNQGAGTKFQSSNNLAPNISRGLVGHWTFDAKDLKTNVADRSGLGNTGYMKGFTSTSSAVTAGKIGQGLKFDGVNDYVNNSTTSNLPVYRTTGYSVSGWIKGKPQSSKSIYGEGNVSDDDSLFYLSNDANGKLGVHIRLDTGVNSRSPLFTDFTALDGYWHHFVWTDSNGTAKMYIDGRLDTQNFNYTPGTITLNTSSVGALRRASVISYFKGSLDDVRIYNRALSAGEIKELYNIGSAKLNSSFSPPDLKKGLVGHWTFDAKDLKNNVSDRSGSGNTGYMMGFTSTSTAVTSGKIGQGLKFDGVDDYVNNPTKIIAALPFTLAGWVKSDGTQRGTILSLESNNAARSTSIGIKETGQAYSIWTDGTVFSILTGTLNITNKWTFVAATYNNPNGLHKLYVNGQYDKKGDAYLTYSITVNSFSVGRTSTSTPASYMKGSLDDVRIYNRALSPSEIKQLYLMGK